MQTVAIFGVGLIGGSFALALKKAGFTGEILGVSSPRSISQAVDRRAIDRGATFEEAAAKADLVYLAYPIERIIEDIARLKPLLKEGALVTDAGSTKRLIVEAALVHLPAGAFLGGHPMAGKESRGVLEADANLFRGRTYVLTPAIAGQLNTAAGQWMLEWVRRIGANPLVLPPEAHDHAVALTSHLPQLASTALTLLLSRQLTDPDEQRTAGPGLQDMSRLALSSFEMWKDILVTNSAEIDAALAAYIDVLTSLRSNLNSQAFADAAEFRRKLYQTVVLK